MRIHHSIQDNGSPLLQPLSIPWIRDQIARQEENEESPLRREGPEGRGKQNLARICAKWMEIQWCQYRPLHRPGPDGPSATWPSYRAYGWRNCGDQRRRFHSHLLKAIRVEIRNSWSKSTRNPTRWSKIAPSTRLHTPDLWKTEPRKGYHHYHREHQTIPTRSFHWDQSMRWDGMVSAL